MLDFVKSNAWALGAGAAATAAGCGITYYATRKKTYDIFPEEMRAELKKMIRKLRNGKDLNDEQVQDIASLAVTKVAEGSLAEEFLDKAKPMAGNVLLVAGGKAVKVAGGNKYGTPAQFDELERILKKMAKKEKDEGLMTKWF